MKRCFRWAFNFATAVSAVPCVALLWFGLSSYVRGWEVYFFHGFRNGRGDSNYCFRIEGGGINIDVQTLDISSSAIGAFRAKGYSPSGDYFQFQRIDRNDYPRRPLGLPVVTFAAWWRLVITSGSGHGITDSGLILPSWFAFTLLAALPCLLIVKRRRQSYAKGRCASCGYDLRATPDRCPECGVTPTGKAAV